MKKLLCIVWFLGVIVWIVKANENPICGNNEEYAECGYECENTCENPERALTCKEPCKAGCICKEGFIRNTKGVCVQPEKCDTCRKHEVFSLCKKDECIDTCEEPHKSKDCKKDDCKPGCVCQNGFLKYDTYGCVKPTKCGTGCGGDINAILSSCGDPCPITCGNINDTISCPDICLTEACKCADGYVRNHNNKCIRPQFCPNCPPNEEYSQCGNNGCQNTCENPTFAQVCKGMCISGCICKQGYLRNSENKCVLPKDCNVCKENEIYNECGDVCPLTCANKNDPPNCIQQCIENGGCVCKPGFVRDHKQNCIDPKNCPTCEGDNEFFDCGSACDTTCATLGEPCPIINIKCNEMCYCKDGFARNDKNICIPIDQCPPKQCKDDPNAIIVACGDPCPTTCENKDDPQPKPCPEICIVNGCKCKEGFVKGKNGKCILIKECPPRCEENEIYTDCGGSKYFNTCEKPEHTSMCTPDDCKPGCSCQPGLVRNEKNKCINPEKCPSTKCQGDPNAQYTTVINNCPITCGNMMTPPMCPLQLPPPSTPCSEIKWNCLCKSDFILGWNRQCIKPEDCPKCKGPNEFYGCGSVCDTTCATLGEPCPIINIKCNEMCYCNDGFARDSNWECIPIEHCPPKQCKDDPNAIMVPCGDPCPTTCENRFEEDLNCPDECIINGCKCKDGYVIGEDGKCILVEECPDQSFAKVRVRVKFSMKKLFDAWLFKRIGHHC